VQIRDREKKAMEDKDPAISRAKRRREILTALPQLFNMMHFLFKSTKRSVMTREELIYQIIKSRFDMIDRRKFFSFLFGDFTGYCCHQGLHVLKIHFVPF